MATKYLDETLELPTLSMNVDRVVWFIRAKKLEFDSIAFSGMSGAIVAPLVAMELNKPIILIRRSTQHTHSGRHIEYSDSIQKEKCKSYIIIDDFIASGDTVKRIKRRMRSAFGKYCQCVCVVCYNKERCDEYRNSDNMCRVDDMPVYAVWRKDEVDAVH